MFTLCTYRFQNFVREIFLIEYITFQFFDLPSSSFMSRMYSPTIDYINYTIRD